MAKSPDKLTVVLVMMCVLICLWGYSYFTFISEVVNGPNPVQTYIVVTDNFREPHCFKADQGLFAPVKCVDIPGTRIKKAFMTADSVAWTVEDQ